MAALAKRRIHEMSGGQQQRVALARALVNKPSVLLLDEPLAALDKKLRTAMQIELQNLQRELGITFVLVTHDQEEALSMSDLVCVMNAGRIVQLGPPQEIYDHPADLFVADFVGKTNRIAATRRRRTARSCALADGSALARRRAPALAPGSASRWRSGPKRSVLRRRAPAAGDAGAPSRTASSSAPRAEYAVAVAGLGDFLRLPPTAARSRSGLPNRAKPSALEFDPRPRRMFSVHREAAKSRTKGNSSMTKNIVTMRRSPPQASPTNCMRLKRGSVTRRHFLGVTGLGLATAVLARFPGPSRRRPMRRGPRHADVASPPGRTTMIPATFENFKAETGVAVEVNVFGSNEEMLAKLQAGASGWDLFVPTNYTISTYQKLGLIDELDLSKLPNFSQATQNPRFTDEGKIDGKTYAVPKNWGTTGFAVNTAKMKTPMTSWKEFFEIAQTRSRLAAPWCTTTS